MEAFGLLLHGFAVLLTWKTLALMMVGLVLGIFVGVLPGLGGPNGVAILLPLTFTMDPTSAIVMLSCIYWGALFGGAITSILFNIPGEAVVGRDHLRRLSDGAAGPGGRSADRRVYLRRSSARWSRVLLITFLAPLISSFALQIRAAGIFRGLSPDVLLLRRPWPRGQAQDGDLDVARAFARRRRHGHGLRAIAHDLRLGRTACAASISWSR